MADTAKESQTAASTQTSDASLLDEIMQQTRLKPNDEGYDVARKGVEAFIAELLKPTHKGEKLNNAVVDKMVAELDERLSRQVDAILHNEDFQKLESAWRGVKYLVDHTDFRQNIRIEMLNVSKDELLDDFEDAP
ncbi:MAG TPA: type VI secretion system contractile sheath large subunit, partial [Stellaceae bacterium]|nr:type VI secretion system contractile sheath large subunit [Stellaceae bacterium]